ncbi:hypothetical protein BC826DRAFT_1050351, partial [Russula brevipes]
MYVILLPVAAVAEPLTSYFNIRAGSSAVNFRHTVGICTRFRCGHCRFTVPSHLWVCSGLPWE